ncbi:uncharacterized protein LOC143018746 [Oratosquilla oratoria]|uniref:uncharacterized protein LOC143018746 n=1 Tax=Oratosquilla oratoria TaxID=337810 RepID=UPI003F775742
MGKCHIQDKNKVKEKCFNRDCRLPKKHWVALSALKELDNIIITKADKGGQVVILELSDYVKKAYDLLNDSETYEKLSKNPLKTSAAEFNKQVCKISVDNCINNLKVTSPKLPYFYGLPKVHKADIPLRSIISNRGSCTTKLSKWLSDLFSPFVGQFSNSHFKNSSDFISKIKDIRQAQLRPHQGIYIIYNSKG